MKNNNKIKMLASSDWCQTFTLGLEIWKKKRKKREVQIGPLRPFLCQTSSKAHEPTLMPKTSKVQKRAQAPNNGD